jgi:hypothetical protein
MKDQASTTVVLTLESESLGSGEAFRGAVAAAQVADARVKKRGR